MIDDAGLNKDKIPAAQKRALKKNEIKTILFAWFVLMAAILFICGNCAKPGRSGARSRFASTDILIEAGANAAAPNMEITNNRISAVIDKITVSIYGGKMGQADPRILGAGIIVSKQSILTNRHIVENNPDLYVTANTGRITAYPVVVYRTDPHSDLVLLQVTNNVDFPVTGVIGDSSAVDVGDIVFAMGNSFGNGNMLTSGMIIDKGFSCAVNGQAYNSMFRTNLNIYPGTCGGPLMNIDGEIIGINNSAAYTDNNYIGIGYAMPINRAMSLIDNPAAGQAVAAGGVPLMSAAYSPASNNQGNPYSLI